MISTWSARSDSQRTYSQDGLYKILRNYEHFKHKLERLQSVLDNTVKPEDLECIKFVM